MSGGLPKGWVCTSIDNLGVITTGNTPSKKDEINFGGIIPFVKPGDLEKGGIITSTQECLSKTGAQFARLLPKNAVMVTCIGNLGKVGIAGDVVATNQQINSIEFIEKNVMPKFGYYRCLMLRDWLVQQASATTLPIVNKNRFSKAPFPLPPLNEQKRIVAKLDAIMPRIEAVKERLEKIPAMLKRFRQSVLTAAVTGKLTEKWREEHPDMESAEELLQRIREEREVRYQNACEEAKKKGARLPKRYREIIEQNNLVKEVDSWAWTYLANVAEVSGGVTKGRVLQGNDIVKLPYLRVANVQDGYLDLSEMKEIEIKKQELDRYALVNGDILFTEGGDRDKLGRGCVWRSEIEVCIHQNHIFKARVNEKFIVPEYITLTTRSSFSKKYFDAVASQTVNLASINMSNLCALPFLLPPLDEQKEIVRQVDKLFTLADKVEEHYQKARARVDALAQSVLAKAFRGELVPQNPDDEPAEKLLQRIQEEKTKMEAELKTASRSARETRKNGAKKQRTQPEEKQASEP